MHKGETALCVSVLGVVHWAGTACSGFVVEYMALPSFLVAMLCELWADCETKRAMMVKDQ